MKKTKYYFIIFLITFLQSLLIASAGQDIQNQTSTVGTPLLIKPGSKDDSSINSLKPVVAQDYVQRSVSMDDDPIHHIQNSNISSDLGEPQIVYNAQGQKISEFFFNSDGSEHRVLYQDNGDVVTVIVDPKKVKQQEITTKPDNSSVTKFYDDQGKLEAMETKLVDGSIVYKEMSEGDMVSAQVINKEGEIEAQTHRDYFGNITTQQHHTDGSINSSTRYRQDVVRHDDGTTETTTYDDHGNSTIVVKDDQGRVLSKKIYDIDGFMSFSIIFNADRSRKEVTYSLGKQLSEETFDSKNRLLLSEKYYASGVIKLRVIYNQAQGKQVVKFDPRGKITSKKTYDADGKIVASQDFYPSGKIKVNVLYHQDGSQEKLNYNNKGKLTSKELYDASGKKLS